MDSLPDDRLDALLRDVAAPQGLAARLKEITNPADDELDELLRGVAMPEQLSLQLHAIPEDDWIESELLAVRPSLTLRSEIRLVTPEQHRRQLTERLQRLSIAALLFLAVSATLGSSLAAYLTAVKPPAIEPQWAVVAFAPETWQGELVPPVEIIHPHPAPIPTVQASQLADVELPPVSEASLLDDWDETLTPVSLGGPVGSWQALVRSGVRPWDDVMLLKYGLLGAPQYAEDELPELVRVSLPARSGLELPLVRGYDRRFWQREGIFPPISPSVDPKLAQLEIPITTSTASLELAAAALAAGRIPSRDELRVEHFLAGLEGRFPSAPRGQLTLNVQGSPSPFGANDAWLLQVGVQAGKLRRLSKQPAHLVIAVDVSSSMGRGGRLDMVRQAIQQAHAQLVPGDVLSLVAFEDGIVCRAEHLTSLQSEELRDELRDLLARGGTNLAAGLQTAASVALTEPPANSNNKTNLPYRTRLVLVTDSRAAMPDNTADKVREVLEVTGDQGVAFDVFDVSGRSEADPWLLKLTEDLSGTYRSIGSRQQLYASLVESFAAQSPAVANEARIRITFNKEAVAAYRLLGHEPNVVAAVVPAAVDAQLLPEEASSTLLELWFKPNASSDLGVVSVSWKDPHTGDRLEKKLPLQRMQFASSFSETPASFQTAAVAAEIAEQLRGSREALRREKLILNENRNSASTIRTVIRPWSSTLRQEPDLQRLLLMVDQMERARR